MFTIVRFLVITAALVMFSVPCLANEYDKDAERTAERQERLDGEEDDVRADRMENQAEAAEGVDGTDSVEGLALDRNAENIREEAEMEREG